MCKPGIQKYEHYLAIAINDSKIYLVLSRCCRIFGNLLSCTRSMRQQIPLANTRAHRCGALSLYLLGSHLLARGYMLVFNATTSVLRTISRLGAHL